MRTALLILGFKEPEDKAEELSSNLLRALYPIKNRVEIFCLPEQGIGYKIYKKAPSYGFSLTAFHYNSGKFTRKAKHIVIATGKDFREAAAFAKIKAIEKADIVLIASKPPEQSSTFIALRESEREKIISLTKLNGYPVVNFTQLKELVKEINEKKISYKTSQSRRILSVILGNRKSA